MTAHPFYPLLQMASRSGMVAVLWVLLFAVGHAGSQPVTGYTDQRPVANKAWVYTSELSIRLTLPESLTGVDHEPGIPPGGLFSPFSAFLLLCALVLFTDRAGTAPRLRPEPRAPPAFLIFR